MSYLFSVNNKNKHMKALICPIVNTTVVFQFLYHLNFIIVMYIYLKKKCLLLSF